MNIDKYKYTIQLKYMKKATQKYVTIPSRNIEYTVIDRSYDEHNMPIVYMGLNIDKNLVDDMILNSGTNLINLEISKFKYDDDNYIPRLEEVYIRSQCTYFMVETVNPNKDLDYADTENGIRTDIFKEISIGLMKIGPININKQIFNKTFDNTTLVNAVRTITNHIDDILIEPLTYGNELLNQISVYQDSVSKSLDALNNIKVFYSTPYRFFIDFDTAYILSSMGLEVPKKGERIAGVLICIKKTEDYIGMDDGMYTNKSQGNYQINVNASSTSLYTDKLTDKVYNKLVAITNSGDKISLDLNIDRSTYGTDKAKTVYIPNDNIHMAENIKARTENSVALLTLCKESLDCEVLTPNHRISVKNIAENVAQDGDYLLSRKCEIFVRDGKDFILSTMANLRRIR